jgi:hypothetical protein
MGKTQVSDKDKPDLERLEAIVKRLRQATTTMLADESGIAPQRIRDLLNNHSYRVVKGTADSQRGIPADLWVYKPTMEDLARPHRAKP